MKKKNLLKLIAPNIVDVAQVPIIKRACLYQLFADKIHILALGDAGACAKTSFSDSLEALHPGWAFFESKSNISQPGVRDKLLKIRFHSYGCAFFDEFPRMDKSIQGTMFGLLQRQTLVINLSEQFWPGPPIVKLPVNVFATANPLKGHWKQYGDILEMKRQLPLESALLRRFHLIICTRRYTLKEFKYVKELYFTTPTDFSKYHEKHESDYENAKEHITDCRKINVEVKLNKLISTFIDKIKKFENDLVFPVTGEILSEFKQLAIARARMDGMNHVTDEHWDEIMDFILLIFQTQGLEENMVRKMFM